MRCCPAPSQPCKRQQLSMFLGILWFIHILDECNTKPLPHINRDFNRRQHRNWRIENWSAVIKGFLKILLSYPLAFNRNHLPFRRNLWNRCLKNCSYNGLKLKLNIVTKSIRHLSLSFSNCVFKIKNRSLLWNLNIEQLAFLCIKFIKRFF